MNESDGFITMFLSMFVVIIFSSWGHHVYVSEFVYQCTLSSFTELWLHFHLCTIVACQWSYRLLTLCTDTVLDIPLLSTYIFHWLLYDVSCDSALPESMGDFFFKTAMGLSFTYGLFSERIVLVCFFIWGGGGCIGDLILWTSRCFGTRHWVTRRFGFYNISHLEITKNKLRH